MSIISRHEVLNKLSTANKWDEVGLIAGGSGMCVYLSICGTVTTTYAFVPPQHPHVPGSRPRSRRPQQQDPFHPHLRQRHPLRHPHERGIRCPQGEIPKNLNVVYTVDKPEGDWKGPVGYINKELIQQHIAPASLGEKVKVLVCGPPGQVKALAGKKDGMKQGALDGILKELGYTEDQVCFVCRWCVYS